MKDKLKQYIRTPKGILVTVLLLFVAVWQAPRLTADDYIITVTNTEARVILQQDKAVKVEKGDLSTENVPQVQQDMVYMVYTANNGTFEMTDSFTYLNFFPDEEWGRLEKGKQYKVTAIWWRVKVPFFPKWSQYENIVRIERLEPTQNEGT